MHQRVSIRPGMAHVSRSWGLGRKENQGGVVRWEHEKDTCVGWHRSGGLLSFACFNNPIKVRQGASGVLPAGGLQGRGPEQGREERVWGGQAQQ